MKRVIIILLFISVAISVKAQRVTCEYNNVSLSEALRQLNEQTEEYTISFLYNELEDFRNWFTIGKTATAMLYLHYATSHDYGFTHNAHGFNVNARVQKTFLDGNLTAAIFANDIFRNLRERWTGCYPVTTTGKDAYVYTQYIGASLTYNFNATRSKYKGTGAGNDEKNRL